MNDDKHIRVVDSVMGSGKTSFAIQEMNRNPKKKYLYVTPILDEVTRIIASCPDLNFREPEKKPNKTIDFYRLIEANHNIACSHSLFGSMSTRLIELLRIRNYELILDEALTVLRNYKLEYEDSDKTRNISKERRDSLLQEDVSTLLESEILSVNNENQVQWVGNRLSMYDKLRDLADREVLYYINNKALIWRFPPEAFDSKIFKTVTILSYQFPYQIMSKYMEYFGITYDKFYVSQDVSLGYFLLPFSDGAIHEEEFRERLKSKIQILHDEKLNEIGNPVGRRMNAMSVTWYKYDTKEKMKVINQNLETFYRYKTDVPASKRAWTIFKEQEKMVRGKYVSSKYHVTFNIRATNQYKDKTSIAYLVNRFPHPDTIHFFRQKGFELNQEEFALSEMLQFIFRFAIRDGEPILVYIPSFRMRRLLELYLDGIEPSEFKKELNI